MNSCPFCLRIQALQKQPDQDLVWSFPYSKLFLGKWQFFHGYCMLVSNSHSRELFDMPAEERAAQFDDLTLAAKAINQAVNPIKMNYELLGNQVPHIHWHLFPRFNSDPEKLLPAWLRLARAEQDQNTFNQTITGPEPRQATIARIQKQLQLLGANIS